MHRFGIAGTVLGFLIVLWWQWGRVKDLPGVPTLIRWIARRIELARRKKLSAAPDDRFSIAIAHFAGDEHANAERLVATELRDFGGIHVVQIDREVPGEGADGHAHARTLLRQVHADALIWGRIMTFAGKTVPRLYWTLDRDLTTPKAADNYRPTDELKLPEVFWDDLKGVLGLLVATAAADVDPLAGSYNADRARPFIARVELLLDAPDWAPDKRAAIESVLGGALLSVGEQTGDNDALRRAVAMFRAATRGFDRERNAREWARAQMQLGLALFRLGERESGTESLHAAIEANQEVLQLGRDVAPADWSAAQRSLGNTLIRLGEREGDPARVDAAIAAYEAGLTDGLRERAPLEWAAIQNSIGLALTKRAMRDDDADGLRAAAKALERALEERTRERVPLLWAMTQSNLGVVFAMLGELAGDSAQLERSVRAFENALLERPRDRVPLEWAATEDNLGLALTMLGERERDPDRLRAAVAAYERALEERTRERVPLDWANTENNRGRALAALAELEGDPRRAQASVDAFRSALLERTPQRVPQLAAETQQNLERAQARLTELSRAS